MHDHELREFFDRVEHDFGRDPLWPDHHQALLAALEAGSVRAATRDDDGTWRAVEWVKRAILLGFANSPTVRCPDVGAQTFFDRAGFPPRAFRADDGVRVVPGGTAVRRGAHVAAGVVIMPPAYVNVGAWIGAGSMVDSHALVGSCAQIGERVHLSAGAQIGGVLEPIHRSPVVVENGVFVGALCGVFEGFVVRERAVLAAGVVLTASSTIFDLVHGVERRGEVPAGAVVVPGSRPARGEFARDRGLQVAAPLIVKYRDANTDAATALEGALR